MSGAPTTFIGYAPVGISPLGQTGATGGPTDLDQVLVIYEVTANAMYATDIYGADNATIQGALDLQIRNQKGGIHQKYAFPSVQLSSTGNIAVPGDAYQTVPLDMYVLERGGSFGTIYAK